MFCLEIRQISHFLIFSAIANHLISNRQVNVMRDSKFDRTYAKTTSTRVLTRIPVCVVYPEPDHPVVS